MQTFMSNKQKGREDSSRLLSFSGTHPSFFDLPPPPSSVPPGGLCSWPGFWRTERWKLRLVTVWETPTRYCRTMRGPSITTSNIWSSPRTSRIGRPSTTYFEGSNWKEDVNYSALKHSCKHCSKLKGTNLIFSKYYLVEKHQMYNFGENSHKFKITASWRIFKIKAFLNKFYLIFLIHKVEVFFSTL